MKFKQTLKWACILSCLNLMGCSSLNHDGFWFRNRSKDYLNAKLTPGLALPQDLSSGVHLSEKYPLPEGVIDLKDKPHEISLEPPGFGKELS